MGFIDSFVMQFNSTFIVDNRWKVFLGGFKNTILITVIAALIGIALGTVIAVIHYMASEKRKRKNLGTILLTIVDKILVAYVAVMRGTPLAIQLMIMAFLILAGKDKLVVACVAFGLNSAAYVSEVIRGGINSVDVGQMEAGRAVGLSFGTSMIKIVIPQAVKNILPTLGNEFISLIKETSVVSFVGAADLYVAFNYIGSNSYEFMVPYLVMALIYIVLVLIISLLIKLMERSLKKSDRRN